MLWSLNHLRSYRIRATDGSLGSVEDVFFDDSSWTVRYLVVDTAWLLGRRVLLPPEVLGHPDAVAHEFPVALTKEAVRNSPDIDTDQPVSRQHETELYGYYGWTPYWGAGGFSAGALPLTGLASPVAGPYPAAAPRDPETAEKAVGEDKRHDPHLRSGHEVVGYHIRATDGSIGHVDDLLIDEAGWVVRYFVVDTRNWLPGRKVLLSPTWIREISWPDRDVVVTVDRKEIEESPDYSPGADIGRDYESRLHRHYGRAGYWV